LNFYSTNKNAPAVDFAEATINGQAPDRGLYFPAYLPQVDSAVLDSIETMSTADIAFRVIKPYVGTTIADDALYTIVSDTLSFDIPLVPVSPVIQALELFHGPTLAFKDVGARFMSRCLGYFIRQQQKTQQVTVLVATSGDTGGAVASGFYEVEGVEVVILYPSGKVSPVQEKQLTTLGKNIHALEIQGTFDDCQRMVKEAFADSAIRSQRFLTSANSINVARWLPQQFYYFLAWKQWADKNNPPVISVPSGNFGNICAGMLAMQTGLPVKHFIAACNRNDIVSAFLRTGKLVPRIAVPTISNAMDVGDPSNFIRILEIFNHQLPGLREKLSAATVTDEQTRSTITRVAAQYGYITDPHGAVAYTALADWLNENTGCAGYFLETAHPVKFPDAVKEATGKEIDIPAALQDLMQQTKKSVLLPPDFNVLKDYLLA